MPHSSKLFNGFYFLDPIDCVEDPCHLAWLVRDNPILLNAVPDAQCANGTSLKNLNPATLCYVNKIIRILNRHQSNNKMFLEIGNVRVPNSRRHIRRSFQLRKLLPVFQQHCLQIRMPY